MGLSVRAKFRIKLASAVGAKDWAHVEELFNQYGGHLDLVAEKDRQKAKAPVTVMAVSIPHRPLFVMEV